MPAKLKILGTQLPISFSLNPQQTVSTVKQLIRTHYSVPVDRQTLRLHHGGGQLMSDDNTLESYGITDGQHVHRLILSVEPGPDVPIIVFLRSGQPQFTRWWAEISCKETTTLAQFKRLVADQLRWAEPDGMAIFRGGPGGRIDEEGNMGRIIREFLIVHGTILWVEFSTNVPQNGTRPPQPPAAAANM
ncbi:unnamed protein product [Linum trigynum]|uniref:Ubiquitin-like domain-containing protein n=1 Tax=Linum trigynum TaxID=586398 RepID=A0AAV2ETT9_9ROSI